MEAQPSSGDGTQTDSNSTTDQDKWFPQFSRLPLELRSKIWRESYEPRIVFCPDGVQNPEKWPTSALALASREACAETFKESYNRSRAHNFVLYICPEDDILLLENSNDPWLKGKIPALAKIQYLATCDRIPCVPKPITPSTLLSFRSLKTFTVILDIEEFMGCGQCAPECLFTVDGGPCKATVNQIKKIFAQTKAKDATWQCPRVRTKVFGPGCWGRRSAANKKERIGT